MMESAMETAMEPASHAYLGVLEDVQHPHHAYYADGDVVVLPLIYLPDIVRICSPWEAAETAGG
jgi:hypothetical protein